MTEKSANIEASEALNIKASKDDVMERIIQHVGEMGTYQRWLVLAMCPFGMALSFIYCVPMFATATPQKHWCRVPELQHLDIDLRRNLSIPGAATGSDWNRCMVYNTNWTKVLETLKPPPPETPTVPCQYGWEFLYDDIPYETVASERGWVCDQASYVPLSQAIFFVGSLVGCCLFGWMGDTYGRLPAFIAANIVGFVGSIASIVSKGVWDYTASKFLCGMANDSCYVMLYILVLEYVGPGHRTWVTNMTMALFCGGGAVLTPVLALWVQDWRKLVLVTSLPMLLALGTPWTVPESVRWLASSDKMERATTVLRKFEKVNKKQIPEDVYTEFIASSKIKSNSDESMKALLKSPPLRNSMIAIILVTMLTCIAFDGILRLSENIGDNFFVTFALSSMAEIPALGVVVLTLDRFGRRTVTVVTLLLAAMFSFLCAFFARGPAQMTLAVVMRFFVNMAMSAETQIVPEMLPTAVRTSGNSLVHVTFYIGTIFSSYIVFLGRYWQPLPLLLFGLMCVVSGAIALLLPETKGRAMPQTIAEGERLVRETVLCAKRTREDTYREIPLIIYNK
ncbi:organic cation transporter protein-like [Galleria mellonella]|uniref:Organic cation transporter protein-like n=1 Tax=Galleria mellonella TaxID=7137 RepID=A0A6J1X998_GALME|nr:organic cation transporter protein-like [Galleria mellonella]